MAGFFGQLAQAAGQNITEGQAFDTRQANLEEHQQQVAMGKMQMMQAQKNQKVQQDVGSMIQAQQLADKTTVDDPDKMAKLYSKAASMEIMAGNFAGAEQMSNLSKGKIKESADAKQQVQDKISQSKESYATALTNYNENPSAETSEVMSRAAMAAGVNPLDMPAPKSAGMAAKIQAAQMGTMSAKQQLDFTEKQTEVKDRSDQAKKVHEDNEADKLAQRQQTGAMQAGLREDRREARNEAAANRQERRQEHLDDIASKRAYDATKQTGAQQQVTDSVVTSANEAVRGFKQIMNMPAGQQSGMFAGLHDGTVLQSLAKASGSAVTDKDAQIYNVATSGLALEIGRVLTLGGGRGVNQSQLNEFKEMLTTRPGEDKYVAMYKLANGVDVLRTRMNTTRDSTNPKIVAQQREVEKFLEKFPTPDAVQAAADKAGRSTGGDVAKNKMGKVINQVGSAFNTDDAPKADATGFQSAMDKYK